MYTMSDYGELLALAVILIETDVQITDMRILCENKISASTLLNRIILHVASDHKSLMDILPLNEVCVALASFSL